MPDHNKNKKYKEEQQEVLQSLLNIISGEDETFLIYDLDNNISDKQTQILQLLNSIKKYYPSSSCRGINNKSCKKPYMSIIRYILKYNGYSLYSKYYSFNKDDKMIKIKKYKIENL